MSRFNRCVASTGLVEWLVPVGFADTYYSLRIRSTCIPSLPLSLCLSNMANHARPGPAYATPSPDWIYGPPRYTSQPHLVPTEYHRHLSHSTLHPPVVAASVPEPRITAPHEIGDIGDGVPRWVYFDGKGEIKRVWKLEWERPAHTVGLSNPRVQFPSKF